MSDQNMSSNDWLLVNEAYIKNQKSRRKKAIVLILILSVFAFAIFLGLKERDQSAYMYGIKFYYDTLNNGSSYKPDFNKIDTKEETEDYLSENGYASYNDMLILLHQLDAKLMEEKYGEGFKVTYEIEKTEAFTKEELEKYTKNSMTTDDSDKAYRLSMKEHFIGPKGEGIERQYMIVSHSKEYDWLYQGERTNEIFKFFNKIKEHYKRLNELSENIGSLSDHEFSDTADQYYAEEVKLLAEEYGEGFQVDHIIKDISPLTEEELKEKNDLYVWEDDEFVKGYKISVIEHFTSSEGKNTDSDTMTALYDKDDDCSFYSERWYNIYKEQ